MSVATDNDISIKEYEKNKQLQRPRNRNLRNM